MARKTVTITEQDIATAVRGDSSHCMIADAIKRTFPDLVSVSVDLATIRWSDPSTRKRHIFLTPGAAQQALLDFDNGKVVPPFTIRIPKVAHIVPMGNRGGARVKPGLDVKAHDMRDGATPTRIGGTAPPTGALASPRTRKRTGKIRGFGARVMTR